MTESLVIYNCETCMFITRNKKDYTRHLKSRKHLDNHPEATREATGATPSRKLCGAIQASSAV